MQPNFVKPCCLYYEWVVKCVVYKNVQNDTAHDNCLDLQTS